MLHFICVQKIKTAGNCPYWGFCCYSFFFTIYSLLVQANKHFLLHLQSCWQFAIAHSALALPTSLHSPFSIKHFLTFILSAHEHLNADVCATSTRAKKRVKIVNLIFSI